MSDGIEAFGQEEMRRFGFDPTNEQDLQEWISTTPPNGTQSVATYEDDALAFGSPATIADCGYLKALDAITSGLVWAQDWYNSGSGELESKTLADHREEVEGKLEGFEICQDDDMGTLFWSGRIACQGCNTSIFVTGKGMSDATVDLPKECNPPLFQRVRPTEVKITINNPQPPRN